ncbi:SDR family oxidoreductase [Phyllobacterium endophyticum]|nr:SDR family oxidoreductase [Phyllobacterium endophyticum]
MLQPAIEYLNDLMSKEIAAYLAVARNIECLPSQVISATVETTVKSIVARVFANELRGRNITVNAVAPGPTGTELFLKGKTENIIDDLARLAPLERIGSPEDIAATVSFLAGVDGGWVNAQIIRSNGGFA